MLYFDARTPLLHDELMYVCTVFCHREPPRRADCLCIRHIFVVFVVAPLLLPHTDDIATASTRPDHPDTTPNFRARVSDDGRERRIASRVLQDAWLPLYV
jgi:hypothetical protein